MIFTAKNLPVSAAEWNLTHHVAFCCLHSKTQQYFAIVGGQMCKRVLRKRTSPASEQLGFGQFLFCVHVLLPWQGSEKGFLT